MNSKTLDEVQKKIFGQRSEKLTPLEIHQLFQLPITPEFNLIFYRALQRNAIDPDISLLQIIPKAKTRDYLIPLSLCLRFGADINMYVNAPKLGIIHILGYVYSILGTLLHSETSYDENILNTIILLLLAKGSRPSFPIYDNKITRSESDKNLPETVKLSIDHLPEPSTPSLTVLEWLNIQGYSTILTRINIGDSSDLQKYIDDQSLTVLSILLDNPGIMKRPYDSKDMILAIKSFSTTSFNKIPLPSNKVMMDYKSLTDTVDYFNSTAFDKLIKQGQLPSYILTNKILIMMRDHKNQNKLITVQELERMLLTSISVGTQLDNDQLNIISVMGRDVLDSVTKEYEQPYWKKICKSSNQTKEVPESLLRLAIALNIDHTMSQAGICDSINTLSKADKEALKQAAIKRQQMRLASDLGTMNEFLAGTTPALVCRNKSLLPNDPFDYNDIDIAYYRDDQGAIWCFGSDSFSSVLESGINPYNSTALPESFKEQLRYQIDILDRLGVNASRGSIGIYASKTPTTFSKALDTFNNKDIITEENSRHALEIFIQIAIANGINSDIIKNLSKENMSHGLRSMGFDIDLTSLSTSHALVTTARIIDYLNKTDPNIIRRFFETLHATADKF